MAKRERLHITMGKKTRASLDDLRDRTDSENYSEVFKNALRLYQELLDQAEAGNKFYTRSEDDQWTELKIFV